MHDFIEKLKNTLNKFFGLFQKEIEKTANIGQKMFSASQANSTLNESYENLGRIVFEQIQNKSLDLKNDEANELVKQILKCQDDLEKLEGDLEKIKSD